MDMVLAVDPSKWTDEAFLNDLVLNCLQRRRGFWLYRGRTLPTCTMSWQIFWSEKR